MSRPGVALARKAAQHRARQAAEAKAAAARTAAEFASQIMGTRLALLSMEEGQDATEILARLAVVIGSPCQACANVYGDKNMPAWGRQLHGALRTIQTMCLEGYRWQSVFALAMDRAVELAAEPRPELTPKAFHAAYLDACHFGNLILSHAVTPQSVNDH